MLRQGGGTIPALGLRMKIAKRCIACDGLRLQRQAAVLMPFVAARVFGWQPIEITSDWGFRDIPAGHAYTVCHSMMCDDCGMLFLDMRFDDEEMQSLYADYRGDDYTKLRTRFEPDYAARNELYLTGSTYLPAVEALLSKHVPVAPAVLDWGGDTGINTPFRSSAKRHDVYEISGCDVVPGARSVSREHVDKNRYDLIAFMQVLEHVAAPRAALAEIATAMAPETVLYVELPYEELVRRVGTRQDRLAQKRHWHEHINFFTPEALDALFVQAGLKIIERTTQAITAGGKDWHNFAIVATRA